MTQKADFNSGFITVEHKETYNLHGESTQDLKLNMDINTIHAGVIGKLGVYNFSVLICIASHMNSKGICFPSQKKISELTGISINKVTKCVKELLETEVEGRPLFERSFAQGIKGKKTVYTFQTDKVEGSELVSEVAVEETVIEEPTTPSKMTAKDVLVVFTEEYQKAFGDGYIVSWGKEMKLVKDKLIPNFEPEDIKKMIHVAVSRYSDKWGNKQYPRPSVSMVCGWLGKEAWKIVLAEKQQEQTFETRVQTLEQSEDEMDRFLGL